MPATRITCLILWIFTLLTTSLCPKADAHPQQSAFIYLHLDQENGLASNHVLSILQDSRGFMWFGTNNGLQRYDGRQFIHFRHDPRNSNSLASDIVESLYEDKEGNIWVASGSTVTLFNPGAKTFLRITLPEQKQGNRHRDRYLTEDKEGELWLASSSGNQAFLYREDQACFVPAASPPQFRHPESLYAALLAPWKSTESYVYLEDSKGNIWAGSENLLLMTQGTADFRLIPQEKASRYGIEYNLIFCLTEDREGTIWIGTDKGVYYFNPRKKRFFASPLPSAPLANATPLLPTDFLQANKDEIWVSTLSRGIMIYDNKFNLINHHPLINKQQATLPVWCMVQDQQGTIWAGSQGGTIIKINAEGNIKSLQPAGLAGQTITKASLDATGTIWFGTEQGLLFTFDPKTEALNQIILSTSAEGLGRILRILPEQLPDVWVATSRGGVFRVHKGSASVVEQYNTTSKPFALLSNELGDMQWADSTKLAVTAIAGLHFIDVIKKTGTTFTTSDGLPANALINIVRTKGEDFYITPQNSLYRWNSRTGKLIGFGARDGLPPDPYIFNTSYRLQDGGILLGTMNEFFYFHPDSLLLTQHPVDVLITGFRIFDKAVELDSARAENGSIRLGHNQNFFTIEYAALSYYDDKRLSYYYQLEGIDRDWVKAGSNRFAHYTNIEGGDYLFKVKAEWDDGTTTVNEASLAIQIEQPFWKSWWFKGILLLALAALASLFYWIRIQRVLALQNMRIQISRDLHDDMGSTLSTINILSAMASSQMEKDLKLTKVHLEKISDYSQRMMEAMDDIVWSINPLNDSATSLVARMRSFCSEVLEPRAISFSIDAAEAAAMLRLPLGLKHNTFMIFKEAVNNAAKYARCQSVRIKIERQRNELLLTICDNGIGFDSGRMGEGNGLLNMHARAMAIGGNVKIHSVKGTGTTITLTVPLTGKGMLHFHRKSNIKQ